LHAAGNGDAETMGIGTSIFLIAVGAILKFAVTAHVSGVSLATVGTILIIVGIVGLLISLFMLAAWRDRDTAPVARDRYVERDRVV
jgi:beta-lactamase regulating signal transducer with metallopeptidase domain